MLLVPGTASHLGIDGYLLVALRRGIVKCKVVEELLDAHAGRFDVVVVGQIATHDGIRGTIGIDGEGGYGFVSGLDEGIVGKRFKLVAVSRNLLPLKSQFRDVIGIVGL